MNRRTEIAAATLTVLLAQADAATAEWTFAAFIGAARTQHSSIRLLQPSESTDLLIAPVVYRAESLEPPIYYGYRVGWLPYSRGIGIEGEFIHLKVVSDTARTAHVVGTFRGEAVSGTRSLGSVVERFSISHGLNLLLVNGVARWPLRRDSRWRVAARAGVGTSVPHPESTIEGASRGQYEWGALSLQAAAGVEIPITRRLYVAGEYKLTHSRQDVSVVRGTIRTPLTTHHLVAGLVAHLGEY